MWLVLMLAFELVTITKNTILFSVSCLEQRKNIQPICYKHNIIYCLFSCTKHEYQTMEVPPGPIWVYKDPCTFYKEIKCSTDTFKFNKKYAMYIIS